MYIYYIIIIESYMLLAVMCKDILQNRWYCRMKRNTHYSQYVLTSWLWSYGVADDVGFLVGKDFAN